MVGPVFFFRAGGIGVIATTLLDPKAFPERALDELYGRGWTAELILRDIKTTMGMDILRCMLHAAQRQRRAPDELSFKASLATLRQWAPHFANLRNKPRKRARLHRTLLHVLADNRLTHRVEPRTRKRRPENYQLLTEPRRQFKETPHRNSYHAA